MEGDSEEKAQFINSAMLKTSFNFVHVCVSAGEVINHKEIITMRRKPTSPWNKIRTQFHLIINFTLLMFICMYVCVCVFVNIRLTHIEEKHP